MALCRLVASGDEDESEPEMQASAEDIPLPAEKRRSSSPSDCPWQFGGPTAVFAKSSSMPRILEDLPYEIHTLDEDGLRKTDPAEHRRNEQ